MAPVRVALVAALACAPALHLVAPAAGAVRVQDSRPPAPVAAHFTSERLVLLASPDNQWTLANGCHGCPAGRVLWLANNNDHHRRIVRKYEHTVTAGWSSDSASFFLNDEAENGSVHAYVIEAESLKTTEIEKLIVAADDEAPKFLRANRAGVAVEHWLAPGQLTAALTGRYDTPNPIAFEIRYAVKLGGSVRRISARQWEPDPDPMPPPEPN